MGSNTVAWSKIGCVCFDVDSTVCVDEGIDELARFLRCKEVENITMRAMNGEIDFTEALTMRLDAMKPSSMKVSEFLISRKSSLTPGVRSLINQLRDCGIKVCLVSGGLYPLVSKVAEDVGIPLDNVFSNRLIFAEDGSYAGFDTSAPTCRSNGKALVVGELMKHFHTLVAIVGDGMTDARACPPAEVFIGFGGNVERPAVRAATPYFFHSMNEISKFLKSVGLISERTQ
ncbi:unnamed protein product [Calicophoron daubneyi]|uniref:Phosphoserine phosphatase n=2 Tax=Calicophoron daubneyi TaxID=300641 RepID=A0AAV2SZW1_CALDB